MKDEKKIERIVELIELYNQKIKHKKKWIMSNRSNPVFKSEIPLERAKIRTLMGVVANLNLAISKK